MRAKFCAVYPSLFSRSTFLSGNERESARLYRLFSTLSLCFLRAKFRENAPSLTPFSPLFVLGIFLRGPLVRLFAQRPECGEERVKKTDTREEGEDWDSTDRESELALKLAGFARLAKILSLSNVVAITLLQGEGKKFAVCGVLQSSLRSSVRER